MDISVVDVTQFSLLLGFVGIIFVLYRLLIQQKDAHIAQQKEYIHNLEKRLERESTDALADSLSKRVSILTEELSRLREDEKVNSVLIKEKEEELKHATEIYQRIQGMIMHTSGMSISFFCPECNKPTIKSTEARVEFSRRESDLFIVKEALINRR